MNQSTELANKLIDKIESKQLTDDELIEWISNTFALNETDSETTLELVKTGLFRASIIASGNNYPKNNLNENELVIASMNIGLNRLGVKPNNKNWIQRIFGK